MVGEGERIRQGPRHAVRIELHRPLPGRVLWWLLCYPLGAVAGLVLAFVVIAALG